MILNQNMLMNKINKGFMLDNSSLHIIILEELSKHNDPIHIDELFRILYNDNNTITKTTISQYLTRLIKEGKVERIKRGNYLIVNVWREYTIRNIK
jgi:predicted transcriptional regulator of viral defense system